MNKGIIIALIIVLAAAAAFFVTSSPGSFLSNTIIQSISLTTRNGQGAFLFTMLGGSGADGVTAQVSKDIFPNWNSEKNLLMGIQRSNNTYMYRLTERSGSTKTINTLELAGECHGLDFWNPYACNAFSSIYRGMTFTDFKVYCKGLNPGAMPVSTGDALAPHWRCYVPKSAWVVADFNKVGGIYEPQVYVTALTYARGTRPWLDNSAYEKVAAVQLSRTNPSGLLVTDGGETLCDATITGMQPTFTSPPDAGAIVAISPPSTPRSFQIVDGGTSGVDQSAQQLLNSLKDDLNTAHQGTGAAGSYLFGIVPVYEDYNDVMLASAINKYNAQVADIGKNNPPVGDFARSDIGLDASKINSDGTIKIQNSFALPSVTAWCYFSSMGVVRANAVPLSISCTSKQLDGGVSSSISARMLNGLDSGVLYWTASCNSPVTVSQASGQVQATSPGQSLSFDVPISTGQQQGLSTCSLTGKSTDLQTTVQGTCTVDVRQVCNTQVPAGCHLKEGCVLDCTVPPEICGDGTKVGACNLQNKRCVNQSGALSLVDATDCTTLPNVTKNTTPLSCYPVVQSASTSYVNPVDFFGLKFGGTPVSTCAWDMTGIGFVFIALALALLGLLHRELEARAIGGIGLLLVVLSLVAGNALSLALGGFGIFLFVGAAVALYLLLKFGVF